ncbi:transcriptional regulator NrdR [Halorhodospira abdelmalekii]|uniref:transcriptional regulator NrdR n=1 Tax=Halorhodospira abdelmalekii TaxID=421629 RepID=UPI00190749ED|nr:transcriptional regulator NrdR [Halorhodospira abdelmalekii]MBK1734693.1 transcriptional regulator NrdR [Halorhodospira abdelmalekii]
MHCPYCRHKDTRVVDSRLAGDGEQVRRRRQCPECGERFTTHEVPDLVMPRVVKADGRREPFDQAKLRAGLRRALEKRPVATEVVEAVVQRLCKRVASRGEREVAAATIGEYVMEALREIDGVAYVRFASVYRRFEDVGAFRRVIEGLEQDRQEREADGS